MSEIKNPNDSLHHYFDELLLDDDLETTASPAQLSFPLLSDPAATQSQLLQPSMKIPVAAPKVVSKVSIPTQRFADPVVVQKEKLQKLLHSARVHIEAAPVVKVEAVVVTTAFRPDPKEIQEWTIATAVPKVAAAILEQQQETAFKQQQDSPQNYHMPGLEWMPNGLPQWAQAKFDVLLFKVSGLTLAVPLISLGQIQPITDELTPLFGQADWFMGIMPTTAGKIRTVNTAKFVMPERYDENFAKNAKYVVSINGVPWGLAVDSVNQPIRLEPDAVQWRTNRSKRPWLAGTIKEHMCALLDIPMIGQMLMDADRNSMKTRLV